MQLKKLGTASGRTSWIAVINCGLEQCGDEGLQLQKRGDKVTWRCANSDDTLVVI